MKTIKFFNFIIFFILFGEMIIFRSLFASTKDEKEYDIKKIPSALLKDADAVILTHFMQFEIKNEHSAKLKVKFAATI